LRNHAQYSLAWWLDSVWKYPVSCISSARTRSLLWYGSSDLASIGIVSSTCRALITSLIRGIKSGLPRRKAVNHAVWFTPAESNVTSSSGTPSSRASSSAVFYTLWHRPMTRTPSRSVAQMLGDIGLV